MTASAALPEAGLIYPAAKYLRATAQNSANVLALATPLKHIKHQNEIVTSKHA
ncbi:MULTISPECIES: hypothetical protein [Comamonas]|uniref:hypothetical protein n=1 Tax=Comamonas TaxID=283 RepID=UPI0015FB96E9|nr:MULTISPECIES: hypothetical protein [Comamonas]UUC94674.1 hypothetical protein NOX35_04875 [Comamonas sp. C11]